MKENPDIMNVVIGRRSFIDTILIPHRCYYNPLKDLFDKKIIRGMAHITGGGIRENLNRILPSGVDAEIDLSSYKVLEIFKVLKEWGEVNDDEMLRTFNLGVGMTLVTSEEDSYVVMKHLASNGVNSNVIGKIVDGNQNVLCKGQIDWEK